MYDRNIFTQEDKDLYLKKGITEEQIYTQLESFRAGFPYLEIAGAVTESNGIIKLTTEEEDNALYAWDEYVEGKKRICKFVPASGAASRMFKDLFEFLDAKYDTPKTSFEERFFQNIPFFAFYDELNTCCIKKAGKDVPSLIDENQYKTIIRLLLGKEGLNYGNKPKGLLLFHNYTTGARTPIEEHLVEGALYAQSRGEVYMHFTVSAEHRILFEQLIAEKKNVYEQMFDVTYHISLSEQKDKTDTIAVNADNTPFKDETGQLVFRPGGHGALIENLNDIDADIIFIINVDNVVPDRLKKEIVKYKKIIAGILVDLQKKTYEYVALLDSGKYTHEQLIEIVHFLQRQLHTRHCKLNTFEDSELAIYLKNKLNRPIRVCGMVKNEGEPGGGPFLAVNKDGSVSPQILESSQIDLKNEEHKHMFESNEYFNPVDLVCGVKDFRGDKYDLTTYIDKNTGFISSKSKNGKDLKALELPGLWNGAMSDWNTVFVEVPAATFNPVKTVNDLLRPEHQ